MPNDANLTRDPHAGSPRVEGIGYTIRELREATGRSNANANAHMGRTVLQRTLRFTTRSLRLQRLAEERAAHVREMRRLGLA